MFDHRTLETGRKQGESHLGACKSPARGQSAFQGLGCEGQMWHNWKKKKTLQDTGDLSVRFDIGPMMYIPTSCPMGHCNV